MQAAMMNQPGDLNSSLVNQLNTFFQKPQAAAGLNPRQPWEGQAAPVSGPAFPPNPGLQLGGVSGAALSGAASGLQAAAQSLLRQRMEALRQQGVGLRGAFAPSGPAPGQWDPEVCRALLSQCKSPIAVHVCNVLDCNVSTLHSGLLLVKQGIVQATLSIRHGLTLAARWLFTSKSIFVHERYCNCFVHV